VIVGLILLFLVSQSIITDMKSFEHNGLSFTEEEFSGITIFHYYYFTQKSGVTGAVTGEPSLVDVFLREDPRTNNVPIDGEIIFPNRGKWIYISVDSTSELSQCTYTNIALSSLSGFLASNGFTVKGAVPDQEEAEERDVRHADCESNPSNTVILIQKGDKSKITKITNEEDGGSCYILEVNDCESLPVVEKFITQTIIDARSQ